MGNSQSNNPAPPIIADANLRFSSCGNSSSNASFHHRSHDQGFVIKARSDTSSTAATDDGDDYNTHSVLSARTTNSTTAPPKPCWGGWLLQQWGTVHSENAIRISTKSTTESIIFPNTNFKNESVYTAVDSDQDSSVTGETPTQQQLSSMGSSSSFEDVDDEDEEDNTVRTIASLTQQGYDLETDNRLPEALAVYQRVLVLLRATGGGGGRIGEMHWRSGVVQYKLGEYAKSLWHLDQGLFVYQLLTNFWDGTDALSNATTVDCFAEILLATGRVYIALGDWSAAKTSLCRALTVLEQNRNINIDDKLSGCSKSLLVGVVLHTLGTVYEAKNEFDKAIRHCQTALRIQRRQQGTNNNLPAIDSAAALMTLGSLYEHKGQYELALRYLTEACDIYRQQSSALDCSTISTDLGMSLTRIGWIRYLKQEYQGALDAFLEAVDCFDPSQIEGKQYTVLMKQMGMAFEAQTRMTEPIDFTKQQADDHNDHQ